MTRPEEACRLGNTDVTIHIGVIGKKLRKILPRTVYSWTKRTATGIVTPVVFSVTSGHFRSSLAGKAVTRRNEPLPWYTYPAIHLLENKKFSDSRVLEFGAGQSTLWWASHAKEVVSYDCNSDWFNELKAHIPENVILSLVKEDLSDISLFPPAGNFDVAIIDGLNRRKAAELILPYLSPTAIVIFDNSDGYWSYDGSHTYPVIELFHQAGFQRVDFYGFSPGLIVPGCTSLFFRENPIFRDPTPPVRAEFMNY